MEGWRSGLFKSGNKTRLDRDRERKSESSIRLASF